MYLNNCFCWVASPSLPLHFRFTVSNMSEVSSSLSMSSMTSGCESFQVESETRSSEISNQKPELVLTFQWTWIVATSVQVLYLKQSCQWSKVNGAKNYLKAVFWAFLNGIFSGSWERVLWRVSRAISNSFSNIFSGVGNCMSCRQTWRKKRS